MGKGKASCGCASPGIGILKSWQGIVEIVLRAVIIFLSICLCIAGATAEDAIEDIPITTEDIPLINPAETKAAAGWLIFVGAIGIIYELVIIIQRIINISIINSFIIVFIVVDAVVNGLLALGAFAGAAAIASYIPDYKDVRSLILLIPEDDPSRDFWLSIANEIIQSTEATAVFGFALMIPLMALVVFMLVGGLFFKWDPTTAKYAGSGGGSASAV